MKHVQDFNSYSLNESSLSRVYSHMSKHDCGVMTAWRTQEGCAEKGDKFYTIKENLQRMKQLKAWLTISGYAVTKVIGDYVENRGQENQSATSIEMSYFVVDFEDRGTLKEDMKRIGEMFMQESILFIPRGGEKAYLIGITVCDDTDMWIPRGEEIEYGKRVSGSNKNNALTFVNNKPFYYKELPEIKINVGDIDESIRTAQRFKSSNIGTKGFVSNLTKMDWENIPLFENDWKFFGYEKPLTD